MLLGEMINVKKYYGDRLVLKVENFKIYTGNRIGIVGINGAGKTTMLDILTGRSIPEEGTVVLRGSYSYITQLQDEPSNPVNSAIASRFNVNNTINEGMSGGEKTRLKIAGELSKNSSLIIADEPTSNLDTEGIELLQAELMKFDGALVLVSHDREFLDQICTSILEIENGNVKLYKGNYSDYRELKYKERNRALFEYEKYTKEKRRLEEAIEDTRNRVKAIRKTPARMGNSEARLHSKMGNQKAKASLDRAVKSLRSRIGNLEVKDKPKELKDIDVNIPGRDKLHSKVLFEGENINKRFGSRVIFKAAEFKVYNGSKTAIIGPNGSGKTTLINMIVGGDQSIHMARTVKVGYFNQNLSLLNLEKSLIENVMTGSIRQETFVRTLLARLLFKAEDLNKPMEVLSGGERVKAALAKIMVSDFNVLILDEPTNYLDLYSLEAVEEALVEYKNTIIFVSHDRRFVNNVADHIMSIEGNRLIMFEGNMEGYLRKRDDKSGMDEDESSIMLLENRIAEVLGRLSMPSKKDNVEALDLEYKELLKKLRSVKG